MLNGLDVCLFSELRVHLTVGLRRTVHFNLCIFFVQI